MKTILVCGATGNTGKATIQELCKESPDHVQVLALVRDPNSDKAQQLKTTLDTAVAAAAAAAAVTIIKGSFDDPASLQKAFDACQPDACFLACSNQLNQIELETNVIEAAEKCSSCNYLVKISTCGAVSDKVGPYIGPNSVIAYSRSHAIIEERLKQISTTKLHYTVLRPNCFMQNHAGDIFGTMSHKFISYPHLSAAASIVDARDVGAVAAKLLLMPLEERKLKHAGKFYDVCGPEALTVQDLAALYSKELSKAQKITIQAKECDIATFQSGLVQGAGFPEWLAEAVTKNHKMFWAEGCLNYPSSPQVLELQPTFRTMQEWVKEMAPMVQF